MAKMTKAQLLEKARVEGIAVDENMSTSELSKALNIDEDSQNTDTSVDAMTDVNAGDTSNPNVVNKPEYGNENPDKNGQYNI